MTLAQIDSAIYIYGEFSTTTSIHRRYLVSMEKNTWFQSTESNHFECWDFIILFLGIEQKANFTEIPIKTFQFLGNIKNWIFMFFRSSDREKWTIRQLVKSFRFEKMLKISLLHSLNVDPLPLKKQSTTCVPIFVNCRLSLVTKRCLFFSFPSKSFATKSVKIVDVKLLLLSFRSIILKLNFEQEQNNRWIVQHVSQTPLRIFLSFFSSVHICFGFQRNFTTSWSFATALFTLFQANGSCYYYDNDEVKTF